MEKDHVVIGLDSYEKLKNEKAEAELAKHIAEKTTNMLIDAMSKLIYSGSKSRVFETPIPSEQNIINLFTEADLRIEFDLGHSQSITCGNGKTVIKLKKQGV